MTALRQELVDLVEIVPEEKIFSVVQYIREKILNQPQKKDPTEMTTKEFEELMAKKYGLRENADEIQAAIDYIKSLHPLMDKSLANKTLEEWREERLKEKYGEYFN